MYKSKKEVLKALHICTAVFEDGDILMDLEDCEDCPYKEYGDKCVSVLHRDAAHHLLERTTIRCHVCGMLNDENAERCDWCGTLKRPGV